MTTRPTAWTIVALVAWEAVLVKAARLLNDLGELWARRPSRAFAFATARSCSQRWGGTNSCRRCFSRSSGWDGPPGGIRTPDLLIRSQSL